MLSLIIECVWVGGNMPSYREFREGEMREILLKGPLTIADLIQVAAKEFPLKSKKELGVRCDWSCHFVLYEIQPEACFEEEGGRTIKIIPLPPDCTIASLELKATRLNTDLSRVQLRMDSLEETLMCTFYLELNK